MSHDKQSQPKPTDDRTPQDLIGHILTWQCAIADYLRARRRLDQISGDLGAPMAFDGLMLLPGAKSDAEAAFGRLLACNKGNQRRIYAAMLRTGLMTPAITTMHTAHSQPDTGTCAQAITDLQTIHNKIVADMQANKESTPQTQPDADLESRAITALLKNDNWPKKRLAEYLGCHPNSLAPKRLLKFDAAWQAVRAQKKDMARGHKSRHGEIEAYSDDD